ncbi:hypothetical protein AJ87_10175 [Rhizobium yanglingense]|nr:hypothetical protein AJ87_10175 [Rhizobium yanglingense]
MLLLPEALDDYVGPDNPVRFIEAFVDRLDLTITGFIRVTQGDWGGRAMILPTFWPADPSAAFAHNWPDWLKI